MDARDLRLLLGVADGADVGDLAARSGISESGVRRRLGRLAGVGEAGWLCRTGQGYRLSERGRAALDAIGRAVTACDTIAGIIDADSVSVRHAQLVDVVAATGSIGGAARHLGLPQPSVSALVARIERQWRAVLFERTPGGVRPTPILVELLPHLRALASVTSPVTDPEEPPVPPGVLQLASEFGFSGLLDALRDDALVDVRQHIVDIPGPDWTPAMLAADICVYADLPLVGLAVPPGWDSTVAFEDPAYVLMPHDVGPGRTEISLRELAGLDWLTGPAGTRNHRSVVSLCRAAGFEPRIRFTALNGPSGRRILEGGGAVALTSATLVPAGTMHTVRLAEDVRIRMTVSWRHRSTATATAGWLVRWLRDQQVRRLAECRPDLLTELRADPARWPTYARQEVHRTHHPEQD
ncbi:LysR family transcriptional regulator [Micromonospora echinofusca]|uniref:LysR family transcriptional regulator n=1 Tax=Micromonospora echinofusca TaxID=47858 RepID=A0ABS3VNE4_MICEH|nr:LysR family transcriptional regulator [Micromonospora echinofusca]MBO4206017.1 LysR family transcriptional regulator [Micromonospora echinofusca]